MRRRPRVAIPTAISVWFAASVRVAALLAALALVVPATLLPVSACGSAEMAGDTLSASPEASLDLGWAQSGEAAGWPDYLPDDIPELEGDITTVMETEVVVRLFYQGVSQEQIEEYLALLEERGFALEYVAYVREGFPDDSEERLAAGDYDAVRATKGDYRMTIESGGGEATLDIDVSGFEIPPSTGLAWPDELAGLVPQPERCAIQSIAPDQAGGYQITGRPEDDQVADDYLQALENAGFAPRTSSIQGPNPVYGRDDIAVMMLQSSADLITIQIWREGPSEAPTATSRPAGAAEWSPAAWPDDLAGVVPEPERCTVVSVSARSPESYLIVCEPADDQVADDYLQALENAGFAPTDPTSLGMAVAPATVYGDGGAAVMVLPLSTGTLQIWTWLVDA